ncbi:MAG: Fe-S cluster assembly protein SufD [Terriglobia bacterium]|jgi:Fe-S cluster assembly protein SufD
MTVVKEQEGLYLSSFTHLENTLNENVAAWVPKLRRTAIESFAELGFPSTHDEEWKYTNVAPLVSLPFAPARVKLTEEIRRRIERLPLADLGCSRLTFFNGRYIPELSKLREVPKGLKAGSLASAFKNHGAVLERHLARYADARTHAFVALNTAFFEDGAFIEVPKGAVLQKPLHILQVSLGGGRTTVSHPRNLILMGSTGQATIIETFFSLAEEPTFTNTVTEIVAGEGALLDYCKVQQESAAALHYARVQVQQERSSTVATHSIQLGGALTREEVQAVLGGEGAESLLHGLYVITGQQHVDNHTTIDHAQPHCSSRELYKGVLEGKSQGVFNGKIIVRPDAQKTDSKQSNKNLLLSEDAIINTKPQLEIFADDVKCTHGATVGQIDAEAVFYLRSRGIAADEAKSLLTYAFANDVMERIKFQPLRERLAERLFARLAKTQSAKEA